MRNRTRFILASATLAFASLPAAAQDSWSDQYDRPGLVGRVFALGQYQGDLVAGGLGLLGDGQEFGITARWDGARWQRMGAGIDSGTPGVPSSAYAVRDFVEYQGDLIAAGQFCCSGSQPVTNIARFDGSVWSQIGSGITGSVWAVAVFQGDLYAAGQFLSASGVAVKNIARWDGAQWHDVGGGLDAGFDPEVWALRVGPDDRLYAAGEFTTAGGATAHNIAAWDGASWSPVGPGLPGPLNATVREVEWYQGRLYACSNFDLMPGGGLDKVAVFDNGAWSSAGVFADSTIATTVWALKVYGADLYAAGNIVDANGVSVERFARFDGTQWTYAGGVTGLSQVTSIFDLEVQGGQLRVGGNFTQAGLAFDPGQPVVSNSVASFNGSGWESVGQGLGFNAAPKAAVMWNGKPVVVGPFTEAGSEYTGFAPVGSGPVMLDGDRWVRLGLFTGSGRLNSATVFQGDLVVAGVFSGVEGQAISGVARYDGSQWTGIGSGGYGEGYVCAEYQGQLYVGGVGGVKRWNGTTFEFFAPQLFGAVLALHVHQGVLYIGGSMNSTSNLVSWDGTAQQTVGGGTNGAVNALATFEGDLIVGGAFLSAGGVPANRLARWDGSAFREFGGISGTVVNSLGVFQGALHASGNLIVPGLPPEKYLARWDGSAWAPLAGGVDGPAATILADDAAGRLFAAGAMQRADGVPSWYFAEWRTTPLSVGTPYCFGDGTGPVPCPCDPGQSGNAGEGCANSFGTGGRISATGPASVNNDRVRLRVEGLPPATSALFFQGNVQQAGGAGVVFGDGLLCVTENIVRLGTRTTAFGVAEFGYGVGADPLVSVRGLLPGTGGTRHYQVWYRNSAAFCTAAVFNLSSGLTIAWTP